jgi:ethanolamine utilization protein
MPSHLVPVWMDEIDYTLVTDPGDQFELIILPHLSIKVMTDLALGRPASRLSSTVLCLLLKGYPIKVMDFAYHAYEQTAPQALWQTYADYESTLAGFGITRFETEAGRTKRVRASLICESDMQQIAASGPAEVILSPSTRITGLAQDLARELGIKILRQD